MARKASTSMSSGRGSEWHNHDKEYRSSLLHVFPYGENYEYTPLIPYKKQINEIMEPFIIQYNERQQEKYEGNLQAFLARERKSRPKLTLKNLDYYESVRKTVVTVPTSGARQLREPFKSLIIMFGNIQDRVTGTITEEEAKAIGGDIVKGFAEAFPGFRTLGASLHCDEAGAYHLHIDYLICAEKNNWKYALPVYTSLDRGLLEMGYQAEVSRYPGKEESAPRIFNAFRNKMLNIVKDAFERQGIALDYGVSLLRYPWKDPSVKWSQGRYKETVSLMNALEDYKVQVTDILKRPEMRVASVEAALKIMSQIREIAEGKSEVQQCARIHGYEVCSELLDHYMDACAVIGVSLYRKIRNIQDSLDSLVLDIEYQTKEVYSLFSQKDKLYGEVRTMERKLQKLERQIQGMMTELEVEQIPDGNGLLAPPMLAETCRKLKKTAQFAVKLEQMYEEAEQLNQKLTAERDWHKRLVFEYTLFLDELLQDKADGWHQEIHRRANIPYEIRKHQLQEERAANIQDIVGELSNRAWREKEKVDEIMDYLSANGKMRDQEEREGP